MPLFANQLLIKLDENREILINECIKKYYKKENQERTELKKKRIHPLNVG